MIQITKDDEIIAVLNFKNGKYAISYLEIDSDIETWFSLFGVGRYFSPEDDIMIPYDKEISILSNKSSLEYQGYQFGVITSRK